MLKGYFASVFIIRVCLLWAQRCKRAPGSEHVQSDAGNRNLTFKCGDTWSSFTQEKALCVRSTELDRSQCMTILWEELCVLMTTNKVSPVQTPKRYLGWRITQQSGVPCSDGSPSYPILLACSMVPPSVIVYIRREGMKSPLSFPLPA